MKNNNFILIIYTIHILPLIIIDIFFLEKLDYINLFVNQVPKESLQDYVNNAVKWKWISHLITIFYITIKSLIVACTVWLSMFLVNKKHSFKSLWHASLLAQLVFALKGYILLVKAMSSSNFNLEELQTFYPLSLASLFDAQNFQVYWLLIFQSINIFEITYWFALAYFLSRTMKITLNEGLKLTLSSYVPAFGLWLLTTTFLIVSNS